MVMALFISAITLAQEKCETPDTTVEDLNSISITKCSIEDVKNALDAVETKQISVRKHIRKSKKNNISIAANSNIQNIKKNTLLVEKLNIKNDALSSLKRIPFHLVEQIPLFSKCENSPLLEQSKCFEEQMIRHVTRHFNYPKAALLKKIEGRVLVQFTINKNGEVENIKKRGPENGEDLEEEAVRLIKKLPKFIPGKHNGNFVNVKYALPITFKTPKKDIKTESIQSIEALYSESEIPFHLVEEIPLFSKCSNNNLIEKTSCFEQEMINHITLNFIYPEEAIQQKIEGKVLIKFTIDQNGNIVDIEKKGPKNGKLLEEEAERLISILPKFIPGKHNGKVVKVKYALPIMFRNKKKS